MLSVLSQRCMKHSKRATLSFRKRHNIKAPLSELYFGYGANLSPDRFSKYHMNYEYLGHACLKDHKLVFTMPCEYAGKGYASVEPSKGDEVWGVVFRMDKHSIRMLDILEWLPFGAYRRKIAKVIDNRGQTIDAHIYIAATPQPNLKPSDQYKTLLLDESQKHGFPTLYIEAIRKVEAGQDFDIDHGFSLLRYGKRRPLENTIFKSLYRAHDTLREKVADFLK